MPILIVSSAAAPPAPSAAIATAKQPAAKCLVLMSVSLCPCSWSVERFERSGDLFCRLMQRILRDRAARAFPAHALHGGQKLVRIGVAARLLQRLIDHVHAVIATERDEIGALTAGGLCISRDILLVQ